MSPLPTVHDPQRCRCTFDQVILEHYTPGEPNSGWVHCSVTGGTNRQARLTIGNRAPSKVWWRNGWEDTPGLPLVVNRVR